MRLLNAAAYGEALSVNCSVSYLTTTVGSAPAGDGGAIPHILPSGSLTSNLWP